MKIRKLYRIESAHIVRKAVSQRCSHSYHGHSGVIEVFFKADHLDNAGMIYDFGAFKKTIGSFIDMFDHSVHLWDQDTGESLDFFTKTNDRYIILPVNPSAENYCVMFRDCISEILAASSFNNGEGKVTCSGVRYHETATGYAESDESDPVKFSLKDITFSVATLNEASEEIVALIKEAHTSPLERLIEGEANV